MARTSSQAPLAVDDNNSPYKWTVMIYMGAETIEGDVPLIEAAKSDIKEMGAVGSGGPLNIFVQATGLDAVPRRAKITEGMTWDDIVAKPATVVPENQRQTAGGLALGAFIITALREAGHDAANPYHYSMLVLWGHAYDFGVARVRTLSGVPDALNFVELGKIMDALQARAQQEWPLKARPRLDVVAFDACDVSTLELAYEIAPYADFLLGSQVGVPIPGWPYDRVLKQLRIPYGRVMSPPEFGVWAVRRFIESYSPLRPVSLSMLSLRRIVPVVARARVLADLLWEAVLRSGDMRSRVSMMFERSLTTVERPYIDVADFALSLVRESGDAAVSTAARALGDALVRAQVPIVNFSDEPNVYPFVVAQGRNAGDTAKLNGVSLYAPHVSTAEHARNVRGLYNTMRFSRDTRWSALVHGLANLS